MAIDDSLRPRGGSEAERIASETTEMIERANLFNRYLNQRKGMKQSFSMLAKKYSIEKAVTTLLKLGYESNKISEISSIPERRICDYRAGILENLKEKGRKKKYHKK